MAEAHWIKPGEIFCGDCGTGHPTTVRKDGSIAVECDWQLPDLGAAKAQAQAAAAAAGGAPAVQQVDVVERVAQRVADNVGERIAAAIADAVAAAVSKGAS